jgi:hypothetical protein
MHSYQFMTPATLRHDPPHSSPDSQTLEDLACAYWQSDLLFAALELNLFSHLAEGAISLPLLARTANFLEEPLGRLLAALAQLGLVDENQGRWRLSPLACRHLVAGTAGYLGDFLLYRRYLQPAWQTLATSVSGRPLPPALSRQDDYPTRNLHYVRALDQLARVKAAEIIPLLADIPWRGPILDLGGGAGALCRALLRQQASTAALFELPEVLTAAHALYPDPAEWKGITSMAGDFRDHLFSNDCRYGLILMANFLHTYDEDGARFCLAKAVSLLSAGGTLLIHDYCPDCTPVKGQLYDLNMMLNTAAGSCHEAQTLARWLMDAGLIDVQVKDLASDSTLILARRPPC